MRKESQATIFHFHHTKHTQKKIDLFRFYPFEPTKVNKREKIISRLHINRQKISIFLYLRHFLNRLIFIIKSTAQAENYRALFQVIVLISVC